MRRSASLLFSLFLFLLLVGCADDDVPDVENEEEIVTYVKLTFTTENGDSSVTATAQDPDGEGPEDLEVTSAIVLAANTTYTLTIELENAIAGESMTEEVGEEADEHMFFFAWTDGLFTDPEGDGNIDTREGPVNYQDFDEKGLPLGLSTSWTTGEAASGSFQVLLKHQPGVKWAGSTSDVGETDIELVWNLEIQ